MSEITNKPVLADKALLDSIDERAQLAGSNCMEILLFSLGTTETFGINVFKVREVSKTPLITRTPNMPVGMEGLISLRGNVIPVLSLARALGIAAMDGRSEETMMVTEYSKRTLGFLVEKVDRIIRVDWEKVRTPDNVSSNAGHAYITAITRLADGRLVSILDVESILASTFGEAVVGHITPIAGGHELDVFFVDDSAVARRKITEVLDKLTVRHKSAQNGAEAWTRLQSMADHAERYGRELRNEIDLIMVDAEMPEMDGYVLIRHIKADMRFNDIPVVMHSSLSSEANWAMGKSVGVDAYVAKFDGNELAETLRPLLIRARQAA